MMHLYLIRHGESLINVPTAQPRPREQLNAGLTDRGEQQAMAAAAWLSQHLPCIDALYASPMKRTQETARFFAEAYQCDINLRNELQEAGNNRIDHSPLPYDQLPNQYSSLSPHQIPFSPVAPMIEQGESVMHCRVRTGIFLTEIIQRHENEVVVVIGHGGTVNGICDIIFNVGSYRRCDVRSYYTGISYFQYLSHTDREPWQLHYLSRVDHLVGL